jgi:hypothetical protein
MPQGLYQKNNCYAMLEEIRTDLNEYSTTLIQGSEVGVFDNSDIVRKINVSQKFIWNILFQQFPDLFLTSASVTGSSGVYTIPSDLYKISNIINSDGIKINPITVKEKVPTTYGSNYLYYRYANTIIRESGVNDVLTFYYYKTVKELTQGMSSAGGAASITLATTAKPTLSYYVGCGIENITDGWTDTITAYTAARAATITNTGAASKYYGTISELPECFHDLISKKATLLLKSTIVSPEKPTQQEMSNFSENLIETMKSYAGTYNGDINIDEIFYDITV